MKQLKTLIKLEQKELDQLRITLTRLERQRDLLIEQIERLHDELVREVELSDTLPEMRGFFGDFSGSIKKKQQAIVANILKMETQIQQVQLKIAERFANLKRYEIAKERFDDEAKALVAAKEQQWLDELGIRNAYHAEQ